MRLRFLAPLGALAALALAFPPAARAQETDGWYVGVDAGGHSDSSGYAQSTFVKLDQTLARWKFHTKNDWDGFARLGYRINPNFREELEFGYRPGKLNYIHGSTLPVAGTSGPDDPLGVCDQSSAAGSCNPVNGRLNTWTLMVNTIYDFFPQSRVRPFVGFGVGADKVSIAVHGGYITVPASSGFSNPQLFEPFGGGQLGFVYQGLGGVSFDVTPRLALDATFRYASGTERFRTRSIPVGPPTGPSTDFELGNFSRPFADSSVSIGVRYLFWSIGPDSVQ